ncbi:MULTISPECIES: hypothetical protein [Methylobacterium]|uniref:Uncharacterized protein n=1 Tax=Methylobacterium marchantiae TaxID=600331 RepID=A0ABW3WWS4_9HYPH|nr:hypothetical protein [Methylobacterium sp. Leaf100]KQP18522.1 hypothetical protein ASF25_11765 [Methylobacterium sp. Leaf100]GJE17254.1 hypothetical protein AIGOOFII_1967 [Methylobacterium marchantiae]
MSFLARIAALAAAAIATVFALIFESGRWVLRAVRSATGVTTPVLPATDAAAAYLDAPAPAVAPSPAWGPAPRHQVGVPLVSYARHLVAGGPAADTSTLPEPILAWARGLSHAELVTLAAALPHEAEAHVSGDLIEGLPSLTRDARRETTPAPVADTSAPNADTSAKWTWTRPLSDHPEDIEIANLVSLALERGRRRKVA